MLGYDILLIKKGNRTLKNDMKLYKMHKNGWILIGYFMPPLQPSLSYVRFQLTDVTYTYKPSRFARTRARSK